MKATISWLVALCLTVAQTVPVHKAPGFEEGKHYVYNYEMRIATGVGDTVRQFSGFGAKCRVAIENHDGELYVRFTDAHFGDFNDVHEHIYEEMRIDYVPMPEEVMSRMSNTFGATYENGVFKSMEAAKSDSVKELNTKKALAALLQLNLYPSDEQDDHFYHVYEDGIGGDCITLYSIAHQPLLDDSNVQVLNVTKTRYYDKCRYRPHQLHISMQGYKCTDCKQANFNPLNELSTIEYKIKGNRQKFTIEEINSNGAIVLTPFTANGQTVFSVTNITLKLAAIEDGTQITKPTDLEISEKLHFVFASDDRNLDEINLKDAHLHVAINDFESDAKTEKLEELLPQLLRPFAEPSAQSKVVGKAIAYMRTFSYDDFKSFFEHHVLVEGDDSKTIKGIMFETIPYVGSNPSLLYMFHLMETGKVDIPTANEWLQKIPFHVKEPSARLVTKFKGFIQSETVTKYSKLVNSGWLAYGTLLHKGCNANLFNPHPSNVKKYIDDTICAGLVEELIEKYNAAKTETEHSVFLRAIKNTHSPATKRFLLSIVQSSNPVLLRLEAVWALFYLLEHGKEEITASMAEVLSNYQEDYLMRIFSFDMIFFSDPSPQLMGIILLKLRKEPCQKVSSYVYQALTTAVNMTEPCFEKYSLNARHALQFIDEPKLDVLRHSINRIFSAYNAQYNYGRTSHILAVPSNTSAFPRLLYLGHRLNIMGYNFDFLEMGYTSEGNNVFEYTLLNALQPENLSPGNLHGDETREHLKNVLDGLNLRDAIKEEIKDYEVYIKLFNQDVLYTRSFGFEEGSRFGGPEISYDGEKATFNVNSVAYVDGRLVIPNELGVPVFIKAKLPMTWHISGIGKIAPRLTSTDNQLALSKRLQGVHGEFDIKFVSDLSVSVTMYVSSLMGDLYGYKLKSHLSIKFPIKGEVNYDFQTQNLNTKYIPSTEEYNIVHYHTAPATFIRTSRPISNGFKAIRYSDKPISKQYSFGHEYFGVGVTCSFKYDYYWNDFGSYRNFVKSFFRKPYRHEDYYYLTDRWYAGSRGLIDYAIVNPTGKPFDFNATYSRDSSHPATEYEITSKSEQALLNDPAKITKKYEVKVIGKGDVERAWSYELSVASLYPLKDVNNFAFKLRQEAVPDLNREPFEVCYSGELRFLDFIKIYQQEPSNVKVKYNGHLLFGPACTNESPQIFVKSEWEQSEEQKNLDRTQCPHYRECQSDVQKENFYSQACWEVVNDLGRLTKFTFDIEHKNIPPQTKVLFLRLYSFFRHYFYDNLEIDYLHGSVEENHIKIVSNVSFDYPVADIHIYRPDQTVHYHKIYLPSIFSRYEPYTVAEMFSSRIERQIFNYNAPVCSLSGDYITTFDGVLYKHHLGDCYYLYFADCLHQSVNVLLKGVTNSQFTKAMRVFLDNVQIDIEPNSENLDVKVNDETVSVEPNKIYKRESEEGKLLFVISKYGKAIYVWAKAYKIEIYFDGINAIVDASNFYQGRQCGLCGNFDGETLGDFVGPDRTVYRNATDFAKSYAVVTQGCTAQ